MNKAYNIVKPIMIVIIICLALIAILSIYNMGYKQLMGSDYAFLLDYSSHEVNEDNMTPDYKRGDLAIIKKDYIYNEGENSTYNYKGSYRMATITEHISGKYTIEDKTDTVDNE